MTSTREPEARRGRPPKGAPHLSRDAIVAAALEAISLHGIDGISLRRVAAALGVDPKSLYNHVSGKDGLLDAVAEHILGSIPLPTPTGDVRRDLRAIAHAFRDSTQAHPKAAPLVLTRQLTSPAGLAPVNAVLTALHAAGCPRQTAVPLLRSLVATVTGTLLREAHATPSYGTADTLAIAQRQTALEQSGFPRLAEAAADLARFDSDAEFAFTLDLALDALMTRLGQP
ncbi:TetR/AcrR family transcriptional regulator C-terminal domain-containing protein [Streptomyces sp. NPDC051014]|uniref:TetR/AcrR family transcriptional regulator n=1 Tax=Streptomyces sp. NPDC051014 TaxID=3155751 RepID=UPI0033F25CFC